MATSAKITGQVAQGDWNVQPDDGTEVWEAIADSDSSYIHSNSDPVADPALVKYEPIAKLEGTSVTKDVWVIWKRRFPDQVAWLKVSFMYYSGGEWYSAGASGTLYCTDTSFTDRKAGEITFNPSLVSDWDNCGLKVEGGKLELDTVSISGLFAKEQIAHAVPGRPF